MNAKIIFLLPLLCLKVFAASAQGIFNQSATERKYMLEQIAALKTYAGYIKKGNDIIKTGTKSISDIKNGELNLHKDHFGSLKTVKPSISGDGRVKSIRDMAASMAKSKSIVLAKVSANGAFTGNEVAEIRKLYAAISDETDKDLDELLLVITDGQLQMSDDERIKEINRLYLRMQTNYTDQKSLNANVLAIAEGRPKVKKDVTTLKKLNGID